MKCRIRRIYIILLFVVGIIFVLLCVCKKLSENRVELLRSESFFDEFAVKEDKVYIKCYLTIQNSSSDDKYMKLSANLDGDARNGLLKSSLISGFNEKGSNEFFIEANATKGYEVTFIGEFGGESQKLSRNLPPIEIKEIRKH